MEKNKKHFAGALKSHFLMLWAPPAASHSPQLHTLNLIVSKQQTDTESQRDPDVHVSLGQPSPYFSCQVWPCPLVGASHRWHLPSYFVITRNVLGATLHFICIFSLWNYPLRLPQFLWSLSKKSVWCWELVMFEICSSHWIITPSIFWKGQHCVAVPAATNCFLFENVLENKSPSGVFSS